MIILFILVMNIVNHVLNVTELTINNCLETPQVDRFDQFINILYSTTHLHAFQSNLLSLAGINPIWIRKTETFQCVLKINKIKTLDLRHDCTLEKIQLIVDLFPQIEYLKIGMNQ